MASDPIFCGGASVPDCPTGHDYAYDEENRVVAIYKDTNNGVGPDADQDGIPDEPKLLEFRYDTLGRRVMTIEYVNPQTGAAYVDGNNDPAPRLTRHVYHGLEVVQEYTCTGDAGGNCADSWTLAREFVWGDGNRFPEPIAMVDYTGANGAGGTGPWTYHYLRDVLGSVIGLTDCGGRLVERYTYDPYGRTLIETWNAATGSFESHNASAFGNPWMWTGQRYDAATGTYAFLFRTYSRTMGRWLQRDPAGYVDGSNLYEYVSSRPMDFTDPSGLMPKSKEGKKLYNELEKLCDTGCKKECDKKEKKKSGQACSKPTASTPKEVSKDECEKDCKKECNSEAEELADLFEQTLEDCKNSGNCSSHAAILNKVFQQRKAWKFFELGAFKPLRKDTGKLGRSHVITTIGLREDRFGATKTTLNGQEYRVWDILVDPVLWNTVWAKDNEPWRPHLSPKDDLRDIYLDDKPPYHPFGPPAPLNEFPNCRDRNGKNPWGFP